MGRGAGKTRAAAEWVRHQVESGAARRLALVGATARDVRDTMVEGQSGILAISPPWFRPRYEPSKCRLTWPNGARATTFSADEPERLRGPEHDGAWLDELAAWRYPAAMSNLLLGTPPRRQSPPLRHHHPQAAPAGHRPGQRTHHGDLAGDHLRQPAPPGAIVL